MNLIIEELFLKLVIKLLCCVSCSDANFINWFCSSINYFPNYKVSLNCITKPTSKLPSIVMWKIHENLFIISAKKIVFQAWLWGNQTVLCCWNYSKICLWHRPTEKLSNTNLKFWVFCINFVIFTDHCKYPSIQLISCFDFFRHHFNLTFFCVENTIFQWIHRLLLRWMKNGWWGH